MNNQQPNPRKRPARLDLSDMGRRTSAHVLDLRPVATILTSPKPQRGPQAPPPPPSAKPSLAAVKTKRARFAEFLQYSLIVLGAMAMAFSSTAGQVLIGLYGLVVLGKKLDSRGPFIIALVMLITIPIFQLISLSGFSENAAIYAYELMVIGVVEVIAETWREGRAK